VARKSSSGRKLNRFVFFDGFPTKEMAEREAKSLVRKGYVAEVRDEETDEGRWSVYYKKE